jgi:hypothetical protein
MPSLPNTDKAQTELYDKVEGSIVAQLSEYRARLKKSKTKVNGAMIDADRRMHDAYETHKASDNEALLNAFLKLKDEEVRLLEVPARSSHCLTAGCSIQVSQN